MRGMRGARKPVAVGLASTEFRIGTSVEKRQSETFLTHHVTDPAGLSAVEETVDRRNHKGSRLQKTRRRRRRRVGRAGLRELDLIRLGG